MKKPSIGFVFSMLFATAAAHASDATTVTCSLVSKDGKSVSLSQEVGKETDGSEMSDSLDSGKYSVFFSFDEVKAKGDKLGIAVIFFESNVLEDELGGGIYKAKLSSATRDGAEVVRDPVLLDGEEIAELVCTLKN